MTSTVGSIEEGVVVDIVDYGAFIRLDNGKTGLVHISEVSSDYVRDVADYLQINDRIKVKVVSINDRGRIELSIKQASDEVKKRPDAETNASAPRPGPDATQEKRPAGPPPQRGPRPPRPSRFGKPSGPASGGRDSFEDKLKSFMKQSDDRLLDVKRSREAKRGKRKK